ncbi:MAG: acyl-CoA transferase [Cellvibrionaceae bacterium]
MYYITPACRLVIVGVISVFLSLNAYAQSDSAESINPEGYVARILNDSPEEVADALSRAEALYLEGKLPASANPISIVLHGPEVEIFFKDNYDEYKNIVDLAARLSAFGVVDVRVCETQTGILGRSRSSVHSFIGTVPFGPTEVKRLLNQQNYVYF